VGRTGVDVVAGALVFEVGVLVVEVGALVVEVGALVVEVGEVLTAFDAQASVRDKNIAPKSRTENLFMLSASGCFQFVIPTCRQAYANLPVIVDVGDELVKKDSRSRRKWRGAPSFLLQGRLPTWLTPHLPRELLLPEEQPHCTVERQSRADHRSIQQAWVRTRHSSPAGKRSSRHCGDGEVNADREPV